MDKFQKSWSNFLNKTLKRGRPVQYVGIAYSYEDFKKLNRTFVKAPYAQNVVETEIAACGFTYVLDYDGAY
jgi:hypothetical protein